MRDVIYLYKHWGKGWKSIPYNGDGWKFQETDLQLQAIVEVLMTHELKDLKQLFYDILHINCPPDLLYDRGYVKVNLCHVLAYFVNEIMEKRAIAIQDKLKQCRMCSMHFYFETRRKNLCEFCYVEDRGSVPVLDQEIQCKL
jgi:hypothetical protein